MIHKNMVYNQLLIYTFGFLSIRIKQILGMTPHRSRLKNTMADRLVLFVMDGLRADKLLKPDLNGNHRSPFLRYISLLIELPMNHRLGF